jgi:hypothetical protein
MLWFRKTEDAAVAFLHRDEIAGAHQKQPISARLAR